MGTVAPITHRAIQGEYFRRLEETRIGWIDRISNLFQTDQLGVETVRFLGMSPSMRKWTGPRGATELGVNEVLVNVDKYEATVEFEREEVTFDRFGQVAARIGELAERANAHWATMLTDLIANGESTAAYDGQNFFDTDHSEGSSGTQSNKVNFTVSGSTPTAAELESALLQAIETMIGFKDDKGELMNENARSFLVMTTVDWFSEMASVLNNPVILESGQARTNLVATFADFSINMVANGRLDSKTGWKGSGVGKFVVFRTDSAIKPFLRFQDAPVNGPGVHFDALGAGSEHEFKTGRHLYGAWARRGTGYGYWQHAVLMNGT